jgi:hypothetical protein
MATDLDRYLASIRGATQDVTSVTDRMKAMEREKALQDAYGMAPEMIRAGQGLEAGAMLAQAGGGPQVLLDQMRAQPKSQASPINPALLQQFGVDPTILEGLSPEQQLSTAKALGGQKLQARNISMGERAQGRLERGEYGKPEKWFDDSKKGIRAIESQIADLDKTFNNVKGALDAGTQPADAIVFNFLARFVAGEKGPLAEGDINRLKGKYGAEDYNKVMQYITSEGKSTLTPQQRAAYQELYDMTVKNYDQYKEDLIGNQLTDALRYEGTLFNPETGKLNKRAERYFKKFGYEVESIDGDFSAVKKTQKREVIDANAKSAVSSTGGGQETEVTKLVDQIKDPTQKAQAQAAIQAYKGKAVPEALMQRIKAAAGVQ